jgi:hypothetical protein
MSNAEHIVNFNKWFHGPLHVLIPERDAGFAVLLIAFPLLERYLKGVSGCKAGTPDFETALLAWLPELQSQKNAERFWGMYRHGLLHNLTAPKANFKLSHDALIVELGQDGTVWLNPQHFAERVLQSIAANFSAYEMGGTPLPIIAEYIEPTFGLSYLGTSTPPDVKR